MERRCNYNAQNWKNLTGIYISCPWPWVTVIQFKWKKKKKKKKRQ